MVIVHNLFAINAKRNLGVVEKEKGKSMEKLSSGYRINRASDDAAGLAISEKMRGQVRGLAQASENCSDGMALINTADGAMAEVESILQRIRVLCVQAANDTNTTEDRRDIAVEITELTKEVDHIGKHAEFNTIKILQGSGIQHTTVATDTYTDVVYEDHEAIQKYFNDKDGKVMNCGEQYYMEGSEKTITLDDGTVLGGEDDDAIGGIFQLDFSKVSSNAAWNDLDGAGFTFNCSLGCKQEFTFIFDSSRSGIIDRTPNADIDYGGTENNKVFLVGTKEYSSGEDFVKNITNFIKGINGGNNINVGHDNKIGSTGNYKTLVVYGGLPGSGDDGYLIIGKPKVTMVAGSYEHGEEFRRKRLRFQLGANSGQELSVELPYIDSYALEMQNIDVLSHGTASNSIGLVDNMLETLNSERSRMGAYYNRLEHAVAADDIMNENLTASESRIRDTEMADEMVKMTKYNILSQAGQSMLANANSLNDVVAVLLRQ